MSKEMNPPCKLPCCGKRFPLLSIIRTVGFLALICIHPAASAADFVVEPAPEWDALFDRTSGWTGGDGIYSIPLSGIEAPGSGSAAPTLFTFGDTFIGQVDPNGNRLAGTTIVNNTLAVLNGDIPDPDRILFLFSKDRALFIPDTPQSNPGDWYWMMDGISFQDKVWIFTLRLEKAGSFFAIAGVVLITIPLDQGWDPSLVTQEDTSLYLPPAGGLGDVVYGQAVMPNTAASGAPHPDGFIYIYGVRSDAGSKKLLASRLPEGSQDLADLRFYDGAAWTTQIEDATPLTDRISQELSVTPLPDGRYVAVFQLDTLGRDVAIRIGQSPVGPFGPVMKIYRCPEPDLYPGQGVFTYNAKAHPHLSGPGELLISYNVNTTDFGAHFTNADIYRPRFIRLRFQDP